MMVTIGCVWLVIFKGVLWGIAVIFLIYNGGGMLPLLAIGFVIDIIINMIVYKTPLGNQKKEMEAKIKFIGSLNIIYGLNIKIFSKFKISNNAS